MRSWGDAHARFGRLSRADVLAPAIELARDGFPAWSGFISAVETTLKAIEPVVGSGSAFERVFRPHGRRWRPGEIVRMQALAATLERLASAGFDDFYEGDVAERQARGLAAAGCGITIGDLRAHTSTWTQPIATDYRGVRVTTHRPNSSGIVALELLNVLEQFEAPPPEAFGPNGVTDPRWVHLGVEAAKLVMADRDTHLTDPDFEDVPVDRLLSKEHAADHARRIELTHAAAAPAATVPKGGGTIYLATVDGEGNAVSLIESNYMGFGSGVVDPDTGIHYQNRGSFFSLDPVSRRTCSRPGSGRSTRCCRRCCSGRARPARGSSPGRWAATPSPRSTPRSCRPWLTAASTSRPRLPPRAGSWSRPSISRRRSRSAPSRVSRQAY